MRTSAELPDGVRDLIVSGREAWRARNYATARSLFEEALSRARGGGLRFAEVAALHFLGNVAFNQCRDDESRRLHSQALAYSQAHGDDHGVATSLGNLALVDVAAGDFEGARAKFDDAVEAYKRAGMQEEASTLRATAHALLVERVPIESRVRRQPSGQPSPAYPRRPPAP